MTKEYKCAVCLHIAKPSYNTEINSNVCAKCGSEDVFPFRLFRCTECGIIAAQDPFFGEDVSLDPDPTEEQWERESCPSCDCTSYEQVPVNEENMRAAEERSSEWGKFRTGRKI